jgi:hypothetical protein
MHANTARDSIIPIVRVLALHLKVKQFECHHVHCYQCQQHSPSVAEEAHSRGLRAFTRHHGLQLLQALGTPANKSVYEQEQEVG